MTTKTCTCCNRTLNPAKIVSLELDQRINAYHDFGGIPDSHNQGGFDFGPSCAAKARAAAKIALNKPRLISVNDRLGRQVHVRFSSWQRIYDAKVDGDKVTLHRVTQQAGGHAVGGSIDKFTSVSKNHPDFESLAAIAAQMVEDAKAAS